MRPISLEIEGLQSFEKREIINFEHLCEYGLFGIFGPTGSGKSTILDAITLAIYGEVVRIKSGSREDTLFDLLNINSDKIYVSFSFKISETFYKLEREFRKGKKEKKVTSKKVIMYKENVVIAEKVGEIKEEIDKIIGLTMDDFTRSVLLPQGKFSDFLKLGGAERRQMLERLFDLEKYGRELIYKVRGKKSYYSKEIEGIDNQIKGKGFVNLEEIKEIEEDLSNYKSQKIELDRDFDKLDKLYREKLEIKNLQDDLEKYTSEKEILDSEKEEILILEKDLKLHNVAKEICRKYKNFQEEKTLLDKILEELNHLNLVLNTLEGEVNKEKEKFKELNNNILEKEELLEEDKVSKEEWDKVAIIKLQKDEYIKVVNELEKIRKEKEVLINELFKTKEELEEKEKYLEKIKEKLSNLIFVDDKIILDLEKKLFQIDIEKVEKLILKVEKKEKAYEESKSNLKKLEKELSLLEEKVEKESQIEKDYWKGKFINELEDNCPCPICGSLTHPQKKDIYIESFEKVDYSNELINLKGAINSINLEELRVEVEELLEELAHRNLDELLEEKTTLEDEIKKLKEEKEKKNSEKKEFEEVLEEEKNEYTNLKIFYEKFIEKSSNLDKNIKELMSKREEIILSLKNLDEIFVEDNSLNILKLEEYIEKVLEKEKKEEILKDEIKKLKDKRKDIQKYIESEEKSLNEKKGKLSKLKGERDITSKNYDKFQLNYLEILKVSSFDTIEQVEKAVLENEENSKEKLEAYKKKEIEVINSIKIIKEKLCGRSTEQGEIDDLSFKLGKVKIKKEEVDTCLGSLQSKKEQIEKAQEEIKDLLVIRKKFEKSFDIYEDLNKLFEGNKFVEYLALSKLRSIAKVASRRLGNISNGRYGLSTDENGNFLIVDNFNGGERRRSSTLSGGESFLVSLSLALALSSQIQLKGMAQLEFFFLDEGFGTLDTELLDKVISSLENIRDTDGIKIGVISHVEELKERVPRRVEVSGPISGNRGSMIKII